MRIFGAILAAMLLAGVFTSGCGKSDPKKHPLYLKGIQLRDEGDPVEAENFLKRYLEKVPGSPYGHLALASLYDEALNNPAAALYHYDEYLRLAPENEQDRSTVEHYRMLTRTKLLKQLSGEPLPELPATALAAENRQLRKTVEQLRRYIRNQNRRLAELQNGPRQSTPAPASQSAGNRLYTVQKGDTPGSIARRFYGSALKYSKIMEANNLTGNGNLRVGQQLVIPPAEP
ncbi:MAG: LysM peptidoglycan-binding domain-containing protein [Lentisphaeria bacterium]|nr:LysM peptidoglycan-binding domain-containing protein [Lentisphaeria bacterium]